MTDFEKREKELASLEDELQAYAREIQEREHALQIAEAAKREDVTRTDYLFDRINRDNKKLTIEVPPVIQIAPAASAEPAGRDHHDHGDGGCHRRCGDAPCRDYLKGDSK